MFCFLFCFLVCLFFLHCFVCLVFLSGKLLMPSGELQAELMVMTSARYMRVKGLNEALCANVTFNSAHKPCW